MSLRYVLGSRQPYQSSRLFPRCLSVPDQNCFLLPFFYKEWPQYLNFTVCYIAHPCFTCPPWGSIIMYFFFARDTMHGRQDLPSMREKKIGLFFSKILSSKSWWKCLIIALKWLLVKLACFEFNATKLSCRKMLHIRTYCFAFSNRCAFLS